MVIDNNNVIHLFCFIQGDATDYVLEFTSGDNGVTWTSPDTVSSYSRSTSNQREHIYSVSATVDDNNNIHLVYKYNGPPNYINGYDDYPSSHINYVTNSSGSWITQQDIINDESVQAREGNGSTVCYLNDSQIINYHNSQHFAAYDYAWFGNSYHIIYSNNISENWFAGDTLHTFNLEDYDNIILNAPSLMVNNDTLYSVWYQRHNCTVEMKKFDGVTWSNVQTIFNDKYFSAPHPTSYIVKTNSCQNNSTAVAAMLRNATDNYHELILMTKTTNGNWEVDTTQIAEKYYTVEPTIFNDTTYLYLYGNSTYTGGIIKYTKSGGFSALTEMVTDDENERLFDLKSLSDASMPFAYIVANSDNTYFLKIGKVNNLVTDVKNMNENLPTNFSLSQNYPNPFNPSTTIKYSIPVNYGDSDINRNDRQRIILKIYDILGREIATLVNKKQAPGNYSVQLDAENLSSGIYFYSLHAGSFFKTRKMILLK